MTTNVTGTNGLSTSVLVRALAKNGNNADPKIAALFGDDSENKTNGTNAADASKLLKDAADATLGDELFGVSANTDSGYTFQDNMNASSDFFKAFEHMQDVIGGDQVTLTKAQEAKVDDLSSISEKLGANEYVLTSEIKKATQTADDIAMSVTDSEDVASQSAKANGLSILTALKAVITQDKTVKDDKDDNILTANEYEEIKNFFEEEPDSTTAYNNIVTMAQQYGIYANA